AMGIPAWAYGVRNDGDQRSGSFAEAEAHCKEVAQWGEGFRNPEVRHYPGPGAEAKGETGELPPICGTCGNKKSAAHTWAEHFNECGTEPRYTLAQLTRAMAETDPELVAVATRAAEDDPARLERCITTAVERDECGARTMAERRVERARGRLGR
ncbi:MAG TPA: hypothetical protein VN894_16235, partial [Polyangiaceae bacterium]|nr:hypothetical protein [Polyangiaceae bacterium]